MFLISMQLEILEHAKLEIDDGHDFYNLQQTHLGETFKLDVKNCIDRIIKLPTLYPLSVDNIRRSLLHRFPYSVFYAIEENKIIIISVAHQSRRPFYWVEKKEKN